MVRVECLSWKSYSHLLIFLVENLVISRVFYSPLCRVHPPYCFQNYRKRNHRLLLLKKNKHKRNEQVAIPVVIRRENVICPQFIVLVLNVEVFIWFLRVIMSKFFLEFLVISKLNSSPCVSAGKVTWYGACCTKFSGTKFSVLPFDLPCEKARIPQSWCLKFKQTSINVLIIHKRREEGLISYKRDNISCVQYIPHLISYFHTAMATVEKTYSLHQSALVGDQNGIRIFGLYLFSSEEFDHNVATFISS